MKRFYGLVMALLMAVGFGLTTVPAHAQVSSSSLSLVPRKNYVIEPGKSVEDTILIRNLDNKNTLDLTLRVVDFTYTNDTGTPKLLLDQNASPTTWSLRSFMTIPEEVSVAPSSTKTIPLSVKIPSNQGAGSYYSAIVYSSGSGQGGNVGLSASGVTLVFAQVPGQVNENLKLKKLGAYNLNSVNQGYKLFSIDKPTAIGYTLQNNGNVTEAPVGSIKMHYMFGGDTTIDNINPNSSLALIGQTRTFTACMKLKENTATLDGSSSNVASCLEPDLWPGVYTISLDAFYGQNGNDTQEVTGTAYFVYLPIWFIIAFIALILVIIFFIWRTKVNYRRWKRERQAKKQ